MDQTLNDAPDERDRLPDGTERIRTPAISLDSHHYIALSLHNRWIEEVALPAAHGALLDYGCGGQPYRALFESRVTTYVGADVSAASGVTPDVMFKPGEALPLPDASFDTVLSTQVLEHTADPAAYIRECSRVLRPGGILLLTVPMQWRHHEVPFDYWRFTRYGIEQLVRSNGLSMTTIAPCGGVFAVLGQVLMSHLDESRFAHRWMFRYLNRLALWLDHRRPDFEDVLLWTAIAQKP